MPAHFQGTHDSSPNSVCLGSADMEAAHTEFQGRL